MTIRKFFTLLLIVFVQQSAFGQSIESILRGLQERHMALEEKTWARHEYFAQIHQRYTTWCQNENQPFSAFVWGISFELLEWSLQEPEYFQGISDLQDWYSNYGGVNDYVPEEIDWNEDTNTSIGGSPSDGELDSASSEDILIILNAASKHLDRIKTSYLNLYSDIYLNDYITGTREWRVGSLIAFDEDSLPSVGEFSYSNMYDKIPLLASRVSQLKFVPWEFYFELNHYHKDEDFDETAYQAVATANLAKIKDPLSFEDQALGVTSGGKIDFSIYVSGEYEETEHDCYETEVDEEGNETRTWLGGEIAVKKGDSISGELLSLLVSYGNLSNASGLLFSSHESFDLDLVGDTGSQWPWESEGYAGYRSVTAFGSINPGAVIEYNPVAPPIDSNLDFNGLDDSSFLFGLLPDATTVETPWVNTPGGYAPPSEGFCEDGDETESSRIAHLKFASNILWDNTLKLVVIPDFDEDFSAVNSSIASLPQLRLGTIETKFYEWNDTLRRSDGFQFNMYLGADLNKASLPGFLTIRSDSYDLAKNDVATALGNGDPIEYHNFASHKHLQFFGTSEAYELIYDHTYPDPYTEYSPPPAKLKQVLGGDVLVNIQWPQNDGDDYTIDFYDESQKGPQNSETRLYSPMGSPLESITVSSLSDPSFSITAGTANKYYEFEVTDDFSTTGALRTLSYGDSPQNLVKEDKFEMKFDGIENNYEMWDVFFTSTIDGVIISENKLACKGLYLDPEDSLMDPGRYIVSIEENHQSNESRLTEFSYDEQNEDVLTHIEYQGPSWNWVELDEFKSPIKSTSSYLSSSYTAPAAWPDSGSRTVETISSGSTTSYLSSVAGVDVQKSWLHFEDVYTLYLSRATDLSASTWNNSSNLLTKTIYYEPGDSAAGAMDWEIKTIIYPDETASMFEYDYDSVSRETTTTIYEGKPSNTSNPSSITKGFKTEIVQNKYGYTITKRTWDIESNTLIEDTGVSQTNNFGQPQQISYIDGTSASVSYNNNDGTIVSLTGRDGLTTDYTYDALKRTETIDRNGEVTSIDYQGLTIDIDYEGGRSQSSIYNLFGEIESVTSDFGRQMDHSIDRSDSTYDIHTLTDALSGQTVETQYYRDGTIAAITGNAVEGVEYSYDTTSFNGTTHQVVTQTLLNDSASPSNIESTTYVDPAGRIGAIETPSATGLGLAISEFSYNAKGQLESSEDPDGIVASYSYNDLGELETQGLGDRELKFIRNFANSTFSFLTQVKRNGVFKDYEELVTNLTTGALTNNHFDDNGSIINDLSSTVTFSPNPLDADRSVTFANNSSVSVADFTDGRLDTLSGSLGGTDVFNRTFTYDSFGALDSIATADGSNPTNSTIVEFNDDQTIDKITSPDPNTGNLIETIDISYAHQGNGTQVTFNSNVSGSTFADFSSKSELESSSGYGVFPSTHDREITDSEITVSLDTSNQTGTATTKWTYNKAGALTEKSYANGLKQDSFTYTDAGRLESLSRHDGFTIDDIQYDPDTGEITQIDFPAGTVDLSFDYDDLGRIETIQDESGSRDLDYKDGNLEVEDYTAGILGDYKIERSFDTENRLEQIILKENGVIIYQRDFDYLNDKLDAVSDPDGYVTNYAYKPGTLLVSDLVSKENANTVLDIDKLYDGQQRLSSLSTIDDTISFDYTYDDSGRRSRIDLANGEYWEYNYDEITGTGIDAGQVTSAYKKNTQDFTIDGFEFAYQFDDIGNRLQSTRNGHDTDYISDDLNIITSIGTPGFANVHGQTDPNATIEVYSWPTGQAVTSKWLWAIGLSPGNFQGDNFFTDLDLSNLKGKCLMEYNASLNADNYDIYLYWNTDSSNATNVPIKITHAAGVTYLQVDQSQNGNSWFHLGKFTANGVEPITLRISNAGTAGNVIADAVKFVAESDSSETILDSEDSANASLVASTSPDSDGYFNIDVPIDNTGSNGACETILVSATLSGAGSGGSDAVAEETRHVFLKPANASVSPDNDIQWDYTWNARRRLVEMETTAGTCTTPQKLYFSYDSQGRRFSKEVYSWNAVTSLYDKTEETLFLYDGWNLIYEHHTDLTTGFETKKSYTWGLDLSGTFQGAGGTEGLVHIKIEDVEGTRNYFPVYDGRGNVMALVNADTGETEAEYEYGPFGEAIRDPGPVGKENPFRFSTRYHDDETGLIYYGYRYYNPETGKWLSQEPLGEAASLNLYAFCANDPVNHVDVLGLYEKSVQVLNLGTLILDPHQSGHYTQNMGLLEQYGGIVGRALRGAIADYEFAFTAYGYDSVEYQRALKRAGSFRRELKMVQALHARFESEYDFIYNGVAGSNLAGADFHHNQFDLRVNSDVALLKHGNDVNLFKGLILEEATGLAGTTLIGRLIRGAGTASAVTPKAVQGGSFLDKFPRINPRNYGWDPAFGSRAGMLGDLKMFKYKGGTNKGDEVFFRGTSEGYAGSPGLQRIGISPASTDPVVATVFATESSNFGKGVLQITNKSSLKGVEIHPGNVLSKLEAEVGIGLSPLDFAAKANTTITAGQARQILQGMGIKIPNSISGKQSLQTVLENTPRLTPAQVQEFLKKAGNL